MDFTTVAAQTCIPTIGKILLHKDSSFEFIFGYTLLELLIRMKDSIDQAQEFWKILNNYQSIKEYAVSTNNLEYFTLFHSLANLIHMRASVDSPQVLRELLRRQRALNYSIKHYISYILATQGCTSIENRYDVLAQYLNVDFLIFDQTQYSIFKTSSARTLVVPLFKNSNYHYSIVDLDSMDLQNSPWLESLVSILESIDLKAEGNGSSIARQNLKPKEESIKILPKSFKARNNEEPRPEPIPEKVLITGPDKNIYNSKSENQIIAHSSKPPVEKKLNASEIYSLEENRPKVAEKKTILKLRCDYCKIKNPEFKCSNNDKLCRDCYENYEICPKCRKGKTHS